MENILKKIEHELQNKLPGNKAHEIMSPSFRPKNENKTPPKKSSVLILLYPKDNNIYTVLIKRGEDGGVHSGQIALPGGRYEEEDNNLIQTAIRETYEEIGVLPEKVHVLGKLTSLYVSPSNYCVLPVVGILKEAPKYSPNPREVQEVIEISITELFNPQNLKEKNIKLNNSFQIKAPCFEINKHQVWGATAMILNELKEILIRGKIISL